MAESSAKTEYVIGVDLGGTKILAGIFDHQLTCLGRNKISTKSERGAEQVIERIARCVRDVIDECDLDKKQIKGIGLGAPGAVDFPTGRVLFAPNLQWQDVPLKKILEKQLDLPVFVENDCNVAALGVFVNELGSKPKHMIGVFIGTGIGGGIILDGELYSGFNGTAGEIGHMVIEVGGPKCGCGNRGCFEALASRSAIFRKINAAVKDGQKTVLTEMLGPDLKDLRSGDLRKAIRKGDKTVETIVEEAAEYTGIAVANLINIFNPQVVALGGGVIDALGDEMMAIIVETAEDYCMAGTSKGIEIIASKEGDDAGIIGAAVLARKLTK
ncbi:MAG TPA: ROK family protein [Verrucomicrobiae bacterium]|jgi:glucokinase|nr:ROK family protein [Verrucomicrobiae bacterium]